MTAIAAWLSLAVSTLSFALAVSSHLRAGRIEDGRARDLARLRNLENDAGIGPDVWHEQGRAIRLERERNGG